MSMVLGPGDGPGVYHASEAGSAGASAAIVDIGWVIFAVTNGTILATKALGLDGNGYSVVFHDTALHDKSCTISESGTVTTINYTSGDPTQATPSSTLEGAFASSVNFTVQHADTTSTRSYGTTGLTTVIVAVNGTTAMATAGDVAMQVDTGGTANPIPALVNDIPQMRVHWWAKSAGGGAVAPWSVASAGTGATGSNAVTDDKHPLSRAYSPGTTSTGRFGLSWSGQVVFDTTGHVWRYETRFQIPTISNGTDTFTFSAGFHDATAAVDAVDGAYVKIESNAAAALQCMTSANSVRTTTSSGVTIVAGTWYRVVIVVTNVTKVEFYVYAEGSAFPSSPTVTITTNIPTAAARATAVTAQNIKSLGTTARPVNVHYQLVSHDRLAA
jgi:hypothetical protein